MEIVRVAGFAMTAAFAAAVIRRMRPEAGMGLALAAGVMLLLVALSQVFFDQIDGLPGLAAKAHHPVDEHVPLGKVGI